MQRVVVDKRHTFRLLILNGVLDVLGYGRLRERLFAGVIVRVAPLVPRPRAHDAGRLAVLRHHAHGNRIACAAIRKETGGKSARERWEREKKPEEVR